MRDVLSFILAGGRGERLDAPGELARLVLDREVERVQLEHRRLSVSLRGCRSHGSCYPLRRGARPSNCGARFSMNAVAPSIMSAEPIACTSMPSPPR